MNSTAFTPTKLVRVSLVARDGRYIGPGYVTIGGPGFEITHDDGMGVNIKDGTMIDLGDSPEASVERILRRKGWKLA